MTVSATYPDGEKTGSLARWWPSHHPGKITQGVIGLSKGKPPSTSDLIASTGRFGLGERSTPEASRRWARDFFMRKVHEVYPSVFGELRDAVLPIYRREAKRITSSWPHHPRRYECWGYLEEDAPIVTDQILQWASKHHLEGQIEPEPDWHGEDWYECARMDSLWPSLFALDALAHWISGEAGICDSKSTIPRLPRYVLRVAFSSRGPGALPNLFTPQFLSASPDDARGPTVRWIPEFESEEAFRARVRADFETALECYIRMEFSSAIGMIRTPRKTTMDHFLWLVRYQVGGVSCKAIQSMLLPAMIREDAIRHGVKDTAFLIWLKLRKSAKGRPPSKKSGNSALHT